MTITRATPPLAAIDKYKDTLRIIRTPNTTAEQPARAPPSPATDQNSRRTSFELARSAVTESGTALRNRQEQYRAAAMQRRYDREDLERQAVRRWKLGDVYAPHDLTGVEQAKWKKFRKKGRQRFDVVDQLAMNPIEHYKV